MQRQEAAAREGDAGEADAEAVVRGGEEPHVHQMERVAGVQEEEAAGGSPAVDGEQRPGAREGERVPGRQADRAAGARAGPEGDVRAQLRAAAAAHPAVLQRLEIRDPLVWLIDWVRDGTRQDDDGMMRLTKRSFFLWWFYISWCCLF